MYLYYRGKVSFEVKIPQNWFSEQDTEPKIHVDPGSTEPVSRSVPALNIVNYLLDLLACFMHNSRGEWPRDSPPQSTRPSASFSSLGTPPGLWEMATARGGREGRSRNGYDNYDWRQVGGELDITCLWDKYRPIFIKYVYLSKYWCHYQYLR